jgi:hypothetical protein
VQDPQFGSYICGFFLYGSSRSPFWAL